MLTFRQDVDIVLIICVTEVHLLFIDPVTIYKKTIV